MGRPAGRSCERPYAMKLFESRISIVAQYQFGRLACRAYEDEVISVLGLRCDLLSNRMGIGEL